MAGGRSSAAADCRWRTTLGNLPDRIAPCSRPGERAPRGRGRNRAAVPRPPRIFCFPAAVRAGFAGAVPLPFRPRAEDPACRGARVCARPAQLRCLPPGGREGRDHRRSGALLPGVQRQFGTARRDRRQRGGGQSVRTLPDSRGSGGYISAKSRFSKRCTPASGRIPLAIASTRTCPRVG
jgi:hypothetical protein